jgi:hypothetical protein
MNQDTSGRIQMIMKAEIGGRHRLPLLAPLRGAIVIPLVSRWYRPLSRTQPPANGFEPSGFAFDRCSKRSAPQVLSSIQDNSSSKAFASLRSAVSKPSVKESKVPSTTSRASFFLPFAAHNLPRLMAARSSSDLAL